MKKAELEAHRGEYTSLMERARAAEDCGRYRDAIAAAVSSWEFIDGMMQYERRYQGTEFETVPTIDLVLRYAPLLFDAASLAKLDLLLKENKRIDKLASRDLTQAVVDARNQMWLNRRLFSLLETNNEIPEDEACKRLGADANSWRSILAAWEKMGLVEVCPLGPVKKVRLATQLQRPIRAKCPSCGSVGQAAKAELLSPRVCGKCKATSNFVLLPEAEEVRTCN